MCWGRASGHGWGVRRAHREGGRGEDRGEEGPKEREESESSDTTEEERGKQQGATRKEPEADTTRAPTTKVYDFLALSRQMCRRCPELQAKVRADLHIRSDHRPVVVEVPAQTGYWIIFENSVPSLKGWRAKSWRTVRKVRDTMEEGISYDANLEDMQQALEAAARELDPWQGKAKPKNSELNDSKPSGTDH